MQARRYATAGFNFLLLYLSDFLQLHGAAECRVAAFFFDEFLVGAALDYPALVHDKNDIGPADCGETVGNDKRGPAFQDVEMAF